MNVFFKSLIFLSGKKIMIIHANQYKIKLLKQQGRYCSNSQFTLKFSVISLPFASCLKICSGLIVILQLASWA